MDNAKVYHSRALKLACTQLNIKLLHRPPRDPAPGGLIERFFQTVQSQLEAEIRATQLLSLADINRVLQAWLNQEYHAAIHSETGQAPQQRYQTEQRRYQPVHLERITNLFYRRETRTVDRDFSDVSLNVQFYAVDPKLRGDKVEVHYDPFLRGEELKEIQLYSPAGVYLGTGRLYRREKGHHPEPEPSVAKGPITPSYLDALLADQEASHQERRQEGLDFASASRRNKWTLTGLATSLARLLGREGGLSSFRPDELEALGAFLRRHDSLHEGLVRDAVSKADPPSIPNILWQLQSLLSQGDT